MQPSIKELLEQQKTIRENMKKPNRKPGPKPKKVKDDASAEIGRDETDTNE